MADVKIPLSRGAFLNVFRPRATKNDDGTQGSFRYDGTFLMPPETDFEVLKQECLNVVISKFGADKSKWPGVARDKARVLPFKDAGLKDYVGFEAGWTYFSASSDRKPDLRFAKRGADGKLLPILDEVDLYAGCWVQGIVQPYWRKTPKNPGISFDLRAVVLIREDEPFVGSRTNTDEAFAEIVFDGVAGSNSADSLFD